MGAAAAGCDAESGVDGASAPDPFAELEAMVNGPQDAAATSAFEEIERLMSASR